MAAARAFADRFSDEMNVTVLVDFENDSVRTALEVADALGDKLWGVRLDTSETLVDRALWHDMGEFKPTGVTPELVERVRSALDAAGHERVRIVVSGRLRRAEDPRLRGPGLARGRLRRRLLAAAGARTTSPPTWSDWRGATAPKRGVATNPIRVYCWWSDL